MREHDAFIKHYLRTIPDQPNHPYPILPSISAPKSQLSQVMKEKEKKRSPDTSPTKTDAYERNPKYK